jgi:hypothetical protein
MNIRYNITGKDRKNLVAAIGEALKEATTYCGAPSFAYEVGTDYRIDRDGTLTGPDNRMLIAYLRERCGFEPTSEDYEDVIEQPAETAPVKPDKTGLPSLYTLITPRGEIHITEEFATHDEAAAEGYGEAFSTALGTIYAYGDDRTFALVTENKAGEWDTTTMGCDFREAEAPAAPEADVVCIEVPLEGFTPEKLDNLAKMVAAKEALIKQALGIDGPLQVQVLEDRIAFPWFTSTDGAEVNAYAQLIAAICRTAQEKTRVTAQPKEDHANPRFTMRCWLISLGLVGPEYRLIRALMTKTLPGNGAWSKGIDPRQVERAAAKAAAAEAPAPEETAEPAGDLPGEAPADESEESANA